MGGQVAASLSVAPGSWVYQEAEISPPLNRPGQTAGQIPRRAGTGIAESCLLPLVFEKIGGMSRHTHESWEGHARAMEHWLQFRQRS